MLVASLALLSCGPDGRPTTAVTAPSSRLAASADAPTRPQTLRWDFSTTKTWSYAYAQVVKFHAGIAGKNGTGEAQARGTMDLVSKGNGTADLVVHDLELQRAEFFGSAASSARPKLPVMVVPGIREDGSTTEGGSRGSELLRLLVPLPRRPLAIGEVDEVPLSFPFNANGSPLTVRGAARVTLARFAQLHGRTCAILNVVLDISRLEVPPELPGSYHASITGTSELTFDLDDHALVREKAEIAMAMRMDLATDSAAEPPAGMTMETVMTLERQAL